MFIIVTRMESHSNPSSSTSPILFDTVLPCRPVTLLLLVVSIIFVVGKNNVVLSFQTCTRSPSITPLGYRTLDAVGFSRRRKHSFQHSDWNNEHNNDLFHKNGHTHTINNNGRLHQSKSSSPSSTSDDTPHAPSRANLEVYEINDPSPSGSSSFSASRFASTGCWGRRPLLWRNAFSSESTLLQRRTPADSAAVDTDHEEDDDDCPWPTWNEVVEYATDETAEARLISHIPGRATSWELDVGPFERPARLRSALSAPKASTADRKTTLVVNDVNRYHPPLSDWIFDTFCGPGDDDDEPTQPRSSSGSFLPRWRLDDGQISLAHTGGGIGPHVDDYDVFLIQMSGKRVWGVDSGGTVAAMDEMAEGGLVDGIDVRVLRSWGGDGGNGTSTVREFVLEAGDVLYLPPRVGHCGSAVEDYSMTLSVGLRAPSAKEMMTRLVEEVGEIYEGKIAGRYRDPNLLDDEGIIGGGGRDVTSEITPEVKDRARSLFKDAFVDLIDDEYFFDSFFGRLATDSKRYRIDYPPPLNLEGDEGGSDIGAARHIVQKMLEGTLKLYAAEGVAWAHSKVDDDDREVAITRLFVDGKMWELESTSVSDDAERFRVEEMVKMIANNRELDWKMFIKNTKDGGDNTDDNVGVTRDMPQKVVQLLEDLVQQGYLYGPE